MKKLIRFLAAIMAFAALSCMFVACDNKDEDEDIDLPERELFEVTVSFQIKGADGITVLEETDYTYKGHSEPTIVNVVNNYLSVVAGWVCKVDKNNTITKIGGMNANNKDNYFGFVTNVVADENGNVSLNDMSAINLSLDQINKYKSDKKMSDTLLIDGAEFTIILLNLEED